MDDFERSRIQASRGRSIQSKGSWFDESTPVVLAMEECSDRLHNVIVCSFNRAMSFGMIRSTDVVEDVETVTQVLHVLRGER